MAYLTGVPLLWLTGLLAVMSALALPGLFMSQRGGLFDMTRFGPLAAPMATACFLYLATGRSTLSGARGGWLGGAHTR